MKVSQKFHVLVFLKAFFLNPPFLDQPLITNARFTSLAQLYSGNLTLCQPATKHNSLFSIKGSHFYNSHLALFQG